MRKRAYARKTYKQAFLYEYESTKPLQRGPSTLSTVQGTGAVKYGKGPQRLGESGLALHYANIINQIYMIASRPASLPPNTRDTLYQGLPNNIKSALPSRLQSISVPKERPENKLGDDETWDRAESALKEALDEFGKPWKLNEGDGAFYGPKIDISVSDALSRKFQCATLQLDFQLPDRFKLEFSAEDEAKIERPVMIHRAILGSVERMFAILLEHYKGKWPFWLSPRQAILCPVSKKSQAYALKGLESPADGRRSSESSYRIGDNGTSGGTN